MGAGSSFELCTIPEMPQKLVVGQFEIDPLPKNSLLGQVARSAEVGPPGEATPTAKDTASPEPIKTP